MRTLALLSQNQYRERYLYLLAFVVTTADTNFGFRSYENSSLPNLSERRRETPFFTQAIRLWWSIHGAGGQITVIAHRDAEIPIDFVIAERRSDPVSVWGLALFS